MALTDPTVRLYPAPPDLLPPYGWQSPFAVKPRLESEDVMVESSALSVFSGQVAAAATGGAGPNTTSIAREQAATRIMISTGLGAPRIPPERRSSLGEE